MYGPAWERGTGRRQTSEAYNADSGAANYFQEVEIRKRTKGLLKGYYLEQFYGDDYWCTYNPHNDKDRLEFKQVLARKAARKDALRLMKWARKAEQRMCKEGEG